MDSINLSLVPSSMNLKDSVEKIVKEKENKVSFSALAGELKRDVCDIAGDVKQNVVRTCGDGVRHIQRISRTSLKIAAKVVVTVNPYLEKLTTPVAAVLFVAGSFLALDAGLIALESDPVEEIRCLTGGSIYRGPRKDIHANYISKARYGLSYFSSDNIYKIRDGKMIVTSRCLSKITGGKCEMKGNLVERMTCSFPTRILSTVPKVAVTDINMYNQSGYAGLHIQSHDTQVATATQLMVLSALIYVAGKKLHTLTEIANRYLLNSTPK